jgi:hypothetical protein
MTVIAPACPYPVQPALSPQLVIFPPHRPRSARPTSARKKSRTVTACPVSAPDTCPGRPVHARPSLVPGAGGQVSRPASCHAR